MAISGLPSSHTKREKESQTRTAVSPYFLRAFHVCIYVWIYIQAYLPSMLVQGQDSSSSKPCTIEICNQGELK